MNSRGQVCVWRLATKRSLVSLLSVWGFLGVALFSSIASAGPAAGRLGTIFSVSNEVPADLIIAIAIFVAVFLLRIGRLSRREPVRQERHPSERDRF